VDEVTYVINYFSKSIEEYKQYTEKEAPRLQQEHNNKFSDKFNAYRAIYTLVTK
jgi:hypothetical protein